MHSASTLHSILTVRQRTHSYVYNSLRTYPLHAVRKAVKPIVRYRQIVWTSDDVAARNVAYNFIIMRCFKRGGSRCMLKLRYIDSFAKLLWFECFVVGRYLHACATVSCTCNYSNICHRVQYRLLCIYKTTPAKYINALYQPCKPDLIQCNA